MSKNGKDAYYFPHDSNAKDDPKCVLLIEQLGVEGYGIYWILIELLREQPNYCYPINLIPAIARRYNTTADKVRVVVSSYDLFIVEDEKIFFSESLNRRMLVYENNKSKRSIAGSLGNKKRWNKTESSQCDNNAIPLQSQSIASKVKESKVKESKEEHTPPIPQSGECESPLKKIDFNSLLGLYHKTCPSLPKIEKLTDSRKKKMKARFIEMGNDIDKLTKVFEKVEASDFLKGVNGTFKASFNWIFENDNNWLKIYEGNYDNKPQQQTSLQNQRVIIPAKFKDL